MHTNSKYVKPEKTPVPEREGAAKPTEIKMTIGSATAYVNGVAKTLDAAPINRNSRTYLPLRAIANALGVSNNNISWDDSTKTEYS